MMGRRRGRRTNPYAPKHAKRRIKKTATRLAFRNTPHVSTAYKHYQNAKDLMRLGRDAKIYIKHKVRKAMRL